MNMAWIDKNLLPSLKLIDSFRRMKKICIQGISFMENRKISISKIQNKFVLNFKTQVIEHENVESAKITNLPEFTFSHNRKSYVVPNGMSRITKHDHNAWNEGTNDFSIEVDAYTVSHGKINVDCKYYLRYFVPIDKKIYFDD